MGPDNHRGKREMKPIPYVNALDKLLYVRLTRIDTGQTQTDEGHGMDISY